MNDSASPNGGTYSTILGIQRRTNPPNTLAPNKEEKTNLGTIIEESLEREMFVRIQKNLILIKVLADSCGKAVLTIPNRPEKDTREPISNRKEITVTVFKQAIEHVKAAQRRVSAIISPLVFQLYPDQIEAITLYMADAAMACAQGQDIPMGLINEIELPRAQEELSLDNKELSSSSKTGIQNSTISHGEEGMENLDRLVKLRSREYYLFIASIYLSENVEQMDKIFRNKVEKLTRLILPDINSIENACSRINKICTKENKWVWSSDFKTF